MKKLISVLFIMMLLIGCGGNDGSIEFYHNPSPVYTGEPHPTIYVEHKSLVFNGTDSTGYLYPTLNNRLYVQFTVYNNGEEGQDLFFTEFPTTDNEVFVFDSDASDPLTPLSGGASMVMKIYFAPEEWNTEYNGHLYIKTNDPFNPTLTISLYGKSNDSIPSADINIDGEYPDGNNEIHIEFSCSNPQPKKLYIENNGTGDENLFFRIAIGKTIPPSNDQFSVYYNGDEITTPWYVCQPLDTFNDYEDPPHHIKSATLDLEFHPHEDYEADGWVWILYTNDPDQSYIPIVVTTNCP